MEKITFKKMLPQQKTVRFLLATLFLTVGIYLAYPVHGILATFPVCFVFSVLAFLLNDCLGMHLTSAAGIAFFYSLMTDFYDPFIFTLFCAASAFLAALTVRSIRALSKGKKIFLFLSLVVAGSVLTVLLSGTPSSFLSAEKDAREYLNKTYPDQKFEAVTVYYNARKKCYAAEVEYLYEGNILSSSVLFSKNVEDGFLDDFVSWMQEKRKSVFIDVVKKSGEDVLINSAGLTEKTFDGIFRGSYGIFGTEMEPLFHFSATFREEKPERVDFADACRNVMDTMKEQGFDYGSVTFYALDAGNVVYECTVTPETDSELVLSLIKYTK